jgi:transcriptional regulator with XRE-family HTH domain
MPTSPQSRSGTGRARPQAVDRHVAERVRMHRLLLGLTQQQLATRAGITYQQVNKYEKGTNRLTAGRLHAIATALGVEVGALFAGLEDHPGNKLPLTRRVIGRLAQDFLRLPSRAQQEALAALARALATPEAPTAD